MSRRLPPLLNLEVFRIRAERGTALPPMTLEEKLAVIGEIIAEAACDCHPLDRRSRCAACQIDVIIHAPITTRCF